MAGLSDVLVAMERQGEAAGRALAEQDYQASEKPERASDFDTLHDDAWEAALKAMQQTGEPYGDDFKEAEEAFAQAFLDAYIVRLGELTNAEQ
jgi:hypothetical protein